MRQLLGWTWLFCCGTVAAQEIRLPLNAVRVTDGDTIVADVLLPWNITLAGESIRESTYDAWESRKGRGGVVITEAELAKGRQAAQDLADLFNTGQVFVSTEAAAKRDSFGRLLGKYWVHQNGQWTDVREYMASRGNLRTAPMSVSSQPPVLLRPHGQPEPPTYRRFRRWR